MNTQSATGPAGREIQRSLYVFFFSQTSLAENLSGWWQQIFTEADICHQGQQISHLRTQQGRLPAKERLSHFYLGTPSSPHRWGVIACKAKASNAKPVGRQEAKSK